MGHLMMKCLSEVIQGITQQSRIMHYDPTEQNDVMLELRDLKEANFA